jgi:GntR family transcriptional repressor for pyruvate dehydrogenase complex
MSATNLDDSRVSRAEALARWLEAEILSSAVRPGDRLGTKDELKERFGVAVGTLNEAIRLLQARGLVDVRPGPRGGVFAREPSPFVRLGHQVLALKHQGVQAADCLQVRDALDPAVVADAVRHRTAADAAELRGRLARMREARGDPTAFQRANWDLHRRIAEISPNSILRNLYTSMLDVVSSELATVIPDADFGARTDELLSLHHELVDAIAAGDRQRAARAAERHGMLTAGPPSPPP